MHHYETLRKKSNTTCCFPKSSDTDLCSGRLIKCPQRLVTVFTSLVENKENVYWNPLICNKHLLQADADQRIIFTNITFYQKR